MNLFEELADNGGVHLATDQWFKRLCELIEPRLNPRPEPPAKEYCCSVMEQRVRSGAVREIDDAAPLLRGFSLRFCPECGEEQ